MHTAPGFSMVIRQLVFMKEAIKVIAQYIAILYIAPLAMYLTRYCLLYTYLLLFQCCVWLR